MVLYCIFTILFHIAARGLGGTGKPGRLRRSRRKYACFGMIGIGLDLVISEQEGKACLDGSPHDVTQRYAEGNVGIEADPVIREIRNEQDIRLIQAVHVGDPLQTLHEEGEGLVHRAVHDRGGCRIVRSDMNMDMGDLYVKLSEKS